jgi:hypothetical protein
MMRRLKLSEDSSIMRYQERNGERLSWSKDDRVKCVMGHRLQMCDHSDMSDYEVVSSICGSPMADLLLTILSRRLMMIAHSVRIDSLHDDIG